MPNSSLAPSSLARWCGGSWHGGQPEAVCGLSNDTRSLKAGDLFLAIETEQRDGHEFLRQALDAGACGALVSKIQADVSLPQLVVGDVRQALLAMARAYRETWAAKVVGITGSCGKTTCKDLLSLMLGEEATLKTIGNLNNLLGLPISMLRPEAQNSAFAVLEAGISEPGEMALLSQTMGPDLAIVTAIGPAHLQDLGNEEGVAREKGRLVAGKKLQDIFLGETCEAFLKHLGGERAVVVREDDSLQAAWSFRSTSKDGYTELEQNIKGRFERFAYTGSGHGLASNVALASAAAHSLGVSSEAIRSRLSAWAPLKLRGEWIQLGATRLYLDCYNANPMSMHDALETFVAGSPESAPRLYVIGCMEELGLNAPLYHEQLGESISMRAEDELLLMGSDSCSVLEGLRRSGKSFRGACQIETIDEAAQRIAAFPGSVFLKGSRRYRLEAAVEGAKRMRSEIEERTAC